MGAVRVPRAQKSDKGDHHAGGCGSRWWGGLFAPADFVRPGYSTVLGGAKMQSASQRVEFADRSVRRDFIVLLVILSGSLALNVALGRRINTLRSLLPNAVAPVVVPVGTTLPPISAVDLQGAAATISYRVHLPTVLYVFVPTCHWCERNLENIKFLASARAGQYQFIGLSLNQPELKEYVAGHGITFPVYTRVSPEAIKALRLGGTPQTLVVSPEGRLVKNWLGAYDGDVGSDVEAFFGVRLPGLSE